MLTDCPRSGEGVNEWVNKRVLELLRDHKSPQEILSIVKWETRNCGRDVTQDIKHSLETSKVFLETKPRNHVRSLFVNQTDFEEQKNQIEQNAECDREWWKNEWEKLKSSQGGSEEEGEILAQMFKHQYVCIGKNKYQAEIVEAKKLTSVNLSKYQFIVPNPMMGQFGLTKDGKLSKRCQGNGRYRKYLVIEFDKVDDIDHQCRLHKAIKDERCELVMLVLSGNKSVHGWYRAKQMEMLNWKLMQYAIWIGADPATWSQNQWVRIPGGINEKTKQKQEVIYYSQRLALCRP